MKLPHIIEGLSHEQYSAIEAEHSGVIKCALVSPLAYMVAKQLESDGIDEDRDCLRLGRAIHTACLEPEYLSEQYVCWTGGRRAGKEWEQFNEDSVGKTILKEEQLDQAVAMAKAVHLHPVAGPMMAMFGRCELTLVWQHPRTGVVIKCRPDRLTDSMLIDLKSTRDPKPNRFSAQAAGMGYHVQLALYADAVAACGLGAVATKIVAVQSTPPFDVVVFGLSEEVLTTGRFEYERALDVIVAGRESGKWPGQAVDGEIDLRLPMWAAQDFSEDPPDKSSPIGDASF